jgi:hypothetical protein
LTSDLGKITENPAPEVLTVDKGTGIETKLRFFEVDRGLSWEAAEKVTSLTLFQLAFVTYLLLASRDFPSGIPIGRG